LGRKTLKPGYYWQLYWPIQKAELFIKEYAEVISPKLQKIRLLKDKYFYWENCLKSERDMAILILPVWDYYSLSGYFSSDDLAMDLGFKKVFASELIESIQRRLENLKLR
jgi:hypothetical protein